MMLHMLCSAGTVICEVRESHRYSFRWREIGNAKGRLRGTGCQIGAVRVIDRVRSSRWQVSEVTAGESAVEVVTGERDKDGQRSRFRQSKQRFETYAVEISVTAEKPWGVLPSPSPPREISSEKRPTWFP